MNLAAPVHFGHILGTNEKRDCILLILKMLIWCREGGSNPHDRKGRRILSLFFMVLQRVAAQRKSSHKQLTLS